MSSNEYAFGRLFPTNTSLLIFWSYISLFVAQGLLVKAVNHHEIKGFNSITIVLSTEVVKLITCTVVHLTRSKGNVNSLLKELRQNKNLFYYYLIPALLYCLYNNLTFVNLQLFDLATYYCLMQFRIVLTAVIYQILFSRQLRAIQWVSLFLLTVGCLTKEYGMFKHGQQEPIKEHLNVTVMDSQLTSNKTIGPESYLKATKPLSIYICSLLLILLQMFCSCFAGVYNEYLLKDVSNSFSSDVILQNIFMYFDSILCNLVAFKFTPGIGRQVDDEMAPESAGIGASIFNIWTSSLVVLLIFNNTFCGLMASFFLKNLNSILKTFASALELFAITFLAWMIFREHIDHYTIVALVLVSASLIIYSRNPVSTAPPGKVEEIRDKFSLLPTEEEDELFLRSHAV